MWKRNNSFDMDNIDVTFDFTSDTPYYWDGFGDNELGYSKRDPFIITYLLWHIIRTNSVSLFRNCKFQFLESFFVYIGQDEKILQFLA